MNGLAENKKFITTAELKDMGHSYYKIGKLEMPIDGFRPICRLPCFLL